MIEVKKITDIDLGRHAVIEASAGTGKTYTLEHLVLRLIMEGEAKLDELVLVTFTELATAEIKERIRTSLSEYSTKDNLEDDVRNRLHEALNSFDRVQISTIHGFCQQILNTFAFENNMLFTHELNNDAEIFDQVLAEQYRTRWRGHYLSVMEDKERRQAYQNGFMAGTIQSVARSVKSGDRVVPDHDDQAMEKLKSEITVLLQSMAKLVDGRIEEFHNAYKKLEFKKHGSVSGTNFKTLEAQILQPLYALIRDVQAGEDAEKLLQSFGDWRSGIKYSRFKSDGYFKVLIPPKYRDDLNALPELVSEFITCLCSLDEKLLKLEQLKPLTRFAAETARTVAREAKRVRRLKSVLSFQDMQELVLEALDEKKNPNAVTLIGSLRKRFKFAMLDEFQDTDPVQWHIFKSIFVDWNGNEALDNRLLIIGDPKQAIYSFRGADVNTYLEAKQELLQERDACHYNLGTNYRSSVGLIDAFNEIFSGDFFSPDGLDYYPVKSPEAQPNISSTSRDERRALNLMDLNEHKNASQARYHYGVGICKEIHSLLNSDFVYEQAGKGVDKRKLRYSDICILISSRGADLKAIEPLLKRYKIPYRLYKTEGVYSSKESLDLLYLLKAIAELGDQQQLRKAMLTQFFRLGLDTERLIQQMSTINELSVLHPYKQQFRKWHSLAERREWSRLFYDIRKQTGVAFKLNEESDGQRRLTNLEQIFTDLELSVRKGNHNIFDLISLLEKRRKDLVERDDVYQLESDEDKVKILTMHGSKGMQFPVVFHFGLFSDYDPSPYKKYHDSENRLIYDLAKSDDANEKHKQERAEEQERLIYVALTRAMARLYVPLYTKGRGTPVSKLLSPALERCKEKNFCADFSSDYLQGDLKETQATDVSILEQALPEDFLEQKISYGYRMLDFSSFSSIQHRAISQRKSEAVYPENVPDHDDRLPDSSEPEMGLYELNELYTLPMGSKTGNVVHEVLEHVNFADVGRVNNYKDLLHYEEIMRLVDGRLAAYRLKDPVNSDAEPYRNQVLRMVWHTINAQIFEDGFTFGQLSEADRRHEAEFLIPYSLLYDAAEKVRPGYFKGFIDLLFRHNGQYYILDWKTTTIFDGYSKEAMAQNILEKRYDMQYKLYCVAVYQWLSSTMEGFDFERDFGGVLYIYNRGMNVKDHSSGVWFGKPQSVDELSAYRKEILPFVDYKFNKEADK